MPIETKMRRRPVNCACGGEVGLSVSPGGSGGGCGIRTREGLNPTRFPSVRHRPLGESSARKATGKRKHE